METIITIEEQGRNYNSTLEVELGFDVQPAEPMVMYTSNGDGYPGCPAEAVLNSVRVIEYSSDTHTVKRAGDTGWFKMLDRIAEKYVHKNFDQIIEDFFYDEEVDFSD